MSHWSSWKELLAAELARRGESGSVIERMSPPDADLDADANPYALDSIDFVIWTPKRVYFSVYGDGPGWADVRSVPRHPPSNDPS